MQAQPNVSSLLGKLSSATDMSIIHHRNRYMTTPTIGPSQFYEMKVPRVHPTAMLDLRNMRCRFNLTITSTDAGICVSSNFCHPWQRVRVLSGTAVLYDVDNSHLLATILYNAKETLNVAGYQKSLVGDGSLAQRQVWAGNPKEYVVPMFPEGTILRRDGLFDVNGSSDLVLQFWTLPAAAFLYSPANHIGASFSLGQVEISSNYINSPSLQSWFRANPTQITVKDYSYRYNTADQQLSLVRISSSQTSLNGIIVCDERRQRWNAYQRTEQANRMAQQWSLMVQFACQPDSILYRKHGRIPSDVRWSLSYASRDGRRRFFWCALRRYQIFARCASCSGSWKLRRLRGIGPAYKWHLILTLSCS